MKYRVKTEHGELEYKSFGQIEQAWLMGMIEPDDEILEEGHTKWRKASSFPLLARARRHGDDVWSGTWFLWTMIGVVLATVSLVLYNQGEQWLSFFVALVDALLIIKVTIDAQQRRDPHRRRGRR